MTHRITIIATLLFVSQAAIYARPQDGSGSNLSEPASSSAQQTEPSAESDVNSSSRPGTTGSGRIPRTVPRTQPAKAAVVATFELITEDLVASAFFSGPVPRTKAIADDSTLNDVCSIGEQCWAVGERGVVCLSNDGGQTWTTRITPFECSLRSACFLTNKIGWIAGLRMIPGTSRQAAVLLQTRDGGKSWNDLCAGHASSAHELQVVPTAELPGILHVQFFGLEEAIAVTPPVRSNAGNGIFRSSDGGQTWSVIPTDRVGGPWSAAHFLSESEGIVVGQHLSYAVVVSQQAVVINPPQSTLRQVRGVSLGADGNGWIVGDGGHVMTTGNAGVTWKPPAGEFPDRLSDVMDLHTVAHQGSTVLIAGNPGCAVLRSETAGTEWTIHPLPMTGRVTRLHCVSETNVLAVGSFGQILRSEDAGISWQPVRSETLRSGVMTLVTDADRAPWQLLASASGETGVRSVTVQISQPLDDSGTLSTENPAAMSERTRLVVTQFGGNDSTADWMFPRTKPEHHRSSAQLIAEWNRQTDGRLRTLLPLRIAKDIRNWRPSVIVIEPRSEDDAVAAILRDVIPEAMRLAASSEANADLLAQLGLPAWSVERIVSRVPADRTATLSFADADLLPSIGTTTGLLCDAVTGFYEPDAPNSTSEFFRSRAGYEMLWDARESVAVPNLFDGLQNALKSDARRPYLPRSREDLDSLRETVQAAHIESSALNGHLNLATTEDALIGQLQNVGADLPESLALKQLKDLAGLNLQHNNMESYLAVQQEITRRFPASEDARQAAEMLFLFYSSAESRHYRMQAMQKQPGQQTGEMRLPPTERRDYSRSADVLQPIVQSGTAQGFSASAGNSLDALQERWDSHAATALKILAAQRPGVPQPRAVSPTILLRHAANLRNQQRNGEHNTLLSELGQRSDEFGLFAKSEMQVAHQASSPVLPLFNLPRHNERPFLDGALTDHIWEDAQEIPLSPCSQNAAEADTEEFIKQSKRNESSVSSLTMLAWDEEFLYVAARMDRALQSAAAVQPATHRSHDARHDSLDRLELEIDTDRDFTTSFVLTVDESGRTSDRCWLLDKWNPDWFVAVDSDDAAWRFEAAIPLSELSSQPAKPGDLWSIRLRRITPGVLQHELQSGTNAVSAKGTALVRFIRPKVRTRTRAE